MKVFLEDIRSIPMKYQGVRGYNECIQFLKEHKGEITEIYLDQI